MLVYTVRRALHIGRITSYSSSSTSLTRQHLLRLDALARGTWRDWPLSLAKPSAESCPARIPAKGVFSMGNHSVAWRICEAVTSRTSQSTAAPNFVEQDADPSFAGDGATSIVEMLFCTSLVALVGAGDRPNSSTRRLQIVNTKVRPFLPTVSASH